MERWGDRWKNHRERLEANWRQVVGPDDITLVPGDLSFARDVRPDLAFLHSFPGHKVLVPGNHDHWAQGISRERLHELLSEYPTIHFLDYHRPFYESGDYLIVGYKGSEPPEVIFHNQKAFNKSLQHAQNVVAHAQAVVSSYHKVIVTTHYAPSLQERKILAVLNPCLWIHGHAHVGGQDEDLVAEWESTRDNPKQRCVSSDYLHQMPLEITGGVLHPRIQY